ncbi:MAG: LysR family transcriptional regulator [Phascolarctobacterium sp.]|nr:LysR family transcriptional regulator [Phascolarctobacterium sp.]
MDFDFYRNFCVIAEAENITKAAQKLNIAQTALSSQVKKLEQNYGVQLLKTQQGKKKCELTPAGVSFLKRAKAICKLEDDLVLDMQEFSSNIAGTISIAASHGRSRYCLEKYIVPFIKLHPDISYKYIEITVDAQVDAIRNGNLDFAFANAAIPTYPELGQIAQGREYFYVFYHQNTPVPWQEDEYVLPQQLHNLPICTNELQFHTLRKVFSEQELKINIKYLANTVNICMNICQELPVIGVVACMEDDPVPKNMLRKQIKADNLYFEQTFFWNKNRQLSPAAFAFLNYFQQGSR